MKKTFFLALLGLVLYSGLAVAQSTELPIDAETKKITYSEVVQTNPNFSHTTIYDRALSWAMNNKYKITKMDKHNGIIMCEGSIVITYPGPSVGKNDTGFLKFNVTITCKNGRYQYVMTDFHHEGTKGKGNGGVLELPKAACGKYVLPDNGWAKIKKDTPRLMEMTIADLKVSIDPQAPAPAKKENW